MSKTTKMIELRCPEHMRPGQRETLISEGHVCGYCHGNGFFWGSDQYGHRTKCPCPVCNGSGELDAHIGIEWKARKEAGDGA